MRRISFSFDISEEFADMFDQLYGRLGKPKYRILEAAIETFANLPINYQYILKSTNNPDRQLCLGLIGALEAPLRQGVASRKKKTSKSG